MVLSYLQSDDEGGHKSKYCNVLLDPEMYNRASKHQIPLSLSDNEKTLSFTTPTISFFLKQFEDQKKKKKEG